MVGEELLSNTLENLCFALPTRILDEYNTQTSYLPKEIGNIPHSELFPLELSDFLTPQQAQ